MSGDSLARRLAKCRARLGFTWLPGMRMRVWGSSEWFRIADGSAHTGSMEADFDDPATVGCLLALVRRAFGLDMFVVALTRDGGRWEVWARGSDDGPFAWGSTEAQALVEALELRSEAAP